MANQTKFNFTDSTYAGSTVGSFMATSLLGGNSVERGLLTVVQRVKSRRIIRNLETEIEFRDPSAKFIGQTEEMKPEERYLDPIQYEIHKEVEFDAVIQDWESENLKPGAMGDYEGTVELNNFFTGRMAERTAIANERLYWLGKGSTPEAKFAADFPGLLAQIEAATGTFKLKASNGELTITGVSNAGVVTVSSTAALRDGDVVTLVGMNGTQVTADTKSINNRSFAIQVISATTFTINMVLTGTAATSGKAQFINQSNVIQVLASIDNQLSDAIRNQPDLKLQVPMHVARAYKHAQANVATGSGSYWVGDKTLDFLGRAMVEMPHWHGNSILLARTSNLYLGVDLVGDASNIRVVHMGDKTNDDLIRYKAAMKAATNVRFPSEILYLRPQA